ncbi:hypothetical protein GCM10010232_17020 [Streptomyces amakusaensis]
MIITMGDRPDDLRALPDPVAGQDGDRVEVAVPRGAALKARAGGFTEGRRTPREPRRPMKWRTVRRLTRLGRPPVI